MLSRSAQIKIRYRIVPRGIARGCNRVRAMVLCCKVDINLHCRSLEDEALGSQRMRFYTLAYGDTW